MVKMARWMLCLAAIWIPAVHGGSNVVVVAPDSGETYRSIIAQTRALLAKRQVAPDAVVLRTLPEFLKSAEQSPRPGLIVTIGSEAAVEARSVYTGPMVFGLVSRVTYRKLSATPSENRIQTAIFGDHSPARTLAAIKLALPAARTIGIVWSEESAELFMEYQQAARDSSLNLVGEQLKAASEVAAAIERLSRSADVLVAIPDAVVYTRQSIPIALLASYRHRVPVIGYSLPFARAGALMAVYSREEHIAASLADSIAQFLERGTLPPPGPTRGFAVAVNQHVARSLNLYLPDGEVIERQMVP